jgi:UDPglucose--hexose-1-phosphate uridylyltransferase
VSPQRAKRPWQGQTEPSEPVNLVRHDPQCYLCPGNERRDGHKNELFEHTFVFENDFAALHTSPGPLAPTPPHPLLAIRPVQGICDVLVYHPRHDLTLATLPVQGVQRIIEEWIRIYKTRGTENGIEYVQIFEVGTFSPSPSSRS